MKWEVIPPTNYETMVLQMAFKNINSYYDAIKLGTIHIDDSLEVPNINKHSYPSKYILDMIKIEVEVRDFDELNEALEAGADVIMRDNMSCEQMTEAVKIIAGRAKTEASGNITLNNIAQVAKTGVDVISLGALTHSVKAFDISMKIK